jgi:hypothetical protein
MAPDPNVEDDATEHLPDSLAIGVPLTARISRAGPLTLRDEHGNIAFDVRGKVRGGEARTAYVWSCASEGAQRLALRLRDLKEEYNIQTAREASFRTRFNGSPFSTEAT